MSESKTWRRCRHPCASPLRADTVVEPMSVIFSGLCAGSESVGLPLCKGGGTGLLCLLALSPELNIPRVRSPLGTVGIGEILVSMFTVCSPQFLLDVITIGHDSERLSGPSSRH